MPKPTFLNLPDDKRDKLVELALDEFAAHPFHQASLSRIVERAGIAKGSVYQYFEHKLDLYRWLLTHEVPRRKAAAQRSATAAAGSPTDLRGWLRALVLAGIDAMLVDPRLIAIVAPITQATADPELRALYDELRSSGQRAFVGLLEPMRAAGQIRDDVDLELVARIIGLVLGQGIPELVLGRVGLRLADLAAMPRRSRARHTAAITRAVDEALELLLGGIAPPAQRVETTRRRR
ncbi:MAG: TetR/AcrR family transcriptional regulator [Deltaproteobacteria bacterium]|nr:TetR/AcrR family transcriptional regulator [Nannocystaceae bacterium]